MRGGAKSFGICWNAEGRKQNRETLKAERNGSAFFVSLRTKTTRQD
jgi:hypothetical protein